MTVAAIGPRLFLAVLTLSGAAALANGPAAEKERHINKSGADVRTLLRHIPNDLTAEDVAFEHSLRGTNIESDDEDQYALLSTYRGNNQDEHPQARNLEICSKKNEKAEDCGADARAGRGKKCCSGLKCGGEKNKFCVTDKDADDKDDDDAGDEKDKKDKKDKKDDDSNLTTYEAPPIDRSGDKSLGFLWHLYYEPGIKVRAIDRHALCICLNAEYVCTFNINTAILQSHVSTDKSCDSMHTQWAPRGYDFCVMCRNFKCKKGDYVVTSHCSANEKHHRWEWIEVGDGKGLMKTYSEDLCLDGNGDWDFVLRPCDKDNEDQHFENIDLTGEKFQLLPSGHQKSKPQCMTMLVSQVAHRGQYSYVCCHIGQYS